MCPRAPSPPHPPQEDGIAYPIMAYDAIPASPMVGLGHEERCTREERDARAMQRKRKRRKENKQLKAMGAEQRGAEEDDGGRMFNLLNKLSTARTGDEDKSAAQRQHAAQKQKEHQSYQVWLLPGAGGSPSAAVWAVWATTDLSCGAERAVSPQHLP